MSAPFEHAIEDRLREVSIMEKLAERRQGFAGGEDHGSVAEIAIVDDPVEHVGGVRSVALVAEFVDDEDVRVRVGLQTVVDPWAAAAERSPMSSSAVVKRASKPFWLAR